MKTLSISRPDSGGTSASRFASARALAISVAESDSELVEPELIAWIDRSTALASPVLEGCSGPNGWHDYGVSHDGQLEVDVEGDATFIFTDSSPFDSYEHFGPGPFVNVRDDQGREMICRAGTRDCFPLDDWTSKLT